MHTVYIELNGMVQGVGMRFFIAQRAKRYGIKGFVRNRRDGSVECLAQGNEKDVEAFMEALKKESPGNITDFHATPTTPTEPHNSFDIRH